MARKSWQELIDLVVIGISLLEINKARKLAKVSHLVIRELCLVGDLSHFIHCDGVLRAQSQYCVMCIHRKDIIVYNIEHVCCYSNIYYSISYLSGCYDSSIVYI